MSTPSFGPVVIVSIPVADPDRSKAFFVEKLGFTVDTDMTTPTMRWVQLTPPGGGASFTLTTWLDKLQPGGQRGLVIATDDVVALRDQLIARGVVVDPIDEQPYGRFASFDDPDGNGYILMQPPPGMTR